MINFSTRILELLGQPVINLFYCLKLDTLKYTTFYHNIALADGTYTSDCPAIEIDRPRADSVVDRDIYNISLTDSNFSMGSYYENGFTGADVEVRICFVDYYTELPETNETFLIYKGIVESYKFNIDLSEVGTVKTTILCSNPMSNLDAVNSFYSSKDYIRQLNPNDSSFDQIYQGSGPINLKWGKK